MPTQKHAGMIIYHAVYMKNCKADELSLWTMDLPHLWTMLRIDHRRLDNAARYPQPHSPNSNEGIFFGRNEREQPKQFPSLASGEC